VKGENPVSLQIREGEIADSAAIATLLTELGYPVADDFVANKIRQQLGHRDAKLLVAVEDHQVLGLISIHFIPQLALRDFCRISYFCVSKTAQGKGIGTALEEKVCLLARARGCDRIEVHCHSRRKLAHQFYGRQGYSESPKYLIKPLKKV
jgi:GNAT superfamily N-acetyltransferase